MPDSVWPHRLQPTRLPHPWDSLGKNTGVGCHFLLQCMKVKVKVKVKLLSCVWLFGTPWTAAYQAPPSMGFSRQEYWSGLQLPSPIYYTHILFVRLFYQSPNEVLKVSWCDFVSMCFSFPLSSLLLFFLSIFGFVYCDLCVFAVYLLRIFMLSWSIKSYVTMSNLFSGISFRLEVQFV